jgi:hypothetical protein
MEGRAVYERGEGVHAEMAMTLTTLIQAGVPVDVPCITARSTHTIIFWTMAISHYNTFSRLT